jgi:hypothetical protein
METGFDGQIEVFDCPDRPVAPGEVPAPRPAGRPRPAVAAPIDEAPAIQFFVSEAAAPPPGALPAPRPPGRERPGSVLPEGGSSTLPEGQDHPADPDGSERWTAAAVRPSSATAGHEAGSCRE